MSPQNFEHFFSYFYRLGKVYANLRGKYDVLHNKNTTRRLIKKPMFMIM